MLRAVDGDDSTFCVPTVSATGRAYSTAGLLAVRASTLPTRQAAAHRTVPAQQENWSRELETGRASVFVNAFEYLLPTMRYRWQLQSVSHISQ